MRHLYVPFHHRFMRSRSSPSSPPFACFSLGFPPAKYPFPCSSPSPLPLLVVVIVSPCPLSSASKDLLPQFPPLDEAHCLTPIQRHLFFFLSNFPLSERRTLLTSARYPPPSFPQDVISMPLLPRMRIEFAVLRTPPQWMPFPRFLPSAGVLYCAFCAQALLFSFRKGKLFREFSPLCGFSRSERFWVCVVPPLEMGRPFFPATFPRLSPLYRIMYKISWNFFSHPSSDSPFSRPFFFPLQNSLFSRGH